MFKTNDLDGLYMELMTEGHLSYDEVPLRESPKVRICNLVLSILATEKPTEFLRLTDKYNVCLES